MARVTVEDCVSEVDRFELVVLAAERAKRIHSGAAITVPRDGDKDPVIALREIAKGNLSIAEQRRLLSNRLKGHTSIEDCEDDDRAKMLLDTDGDSSEANPFFDDIEQLSVSEFAQDNISFEGDFDDDDIISKD